MLRQESVNPVLASTELLHDEQVMKLVPSLGPVNSQPPNIIFVSNGLQVVETRDVGEIRHSGNSLEDIKSLVRFVFVNGINDNNQCINKFGEDANSLLIDWQSVGNNLIKIIENLVIAITFSVILFNFLTDILVHSNKFLLLLS
jgi:hypothetical protein